MIIRKLMAEAKYNLPSSFNQHKQLATKIKSTIFTLPWVYRTRANKKITSNVFNFPHRAERFSHIRILTIKIAPSCNTFLVFPINSETSLLILHIISSVYCMENMSLNLQNFQKRICKKENQKNKKLEKRPYRGDFTLWSRVTLEI